MRNVGDVVVCRASVLPAPIASISAAKDTAQEYEFTIIGVRGAGKTSSFDYLLLVPDNAPEEIGWEFTEDDINSGGVNGHYNLSPIVVGLRGVGCNETHILRAGAFGNVTPVIMPVELSPKEKELCETIDILEKELILKDSVIADLNRKLLAAKTVVYDITGRPYMD